MAVDGTRLDAAGAQAATRIVEVLREQRKNTHAAAQTELKEKLAGLAAEHKKLAERAAGIRARIAAAQAGQRELAGKQADADAKINAMEARLAAGEGMTSRDLVALQGDIDTAKERRGHSEDDELAVLEEIEGLQAELDSLKSQADQVAASGQAAQAQRKETAERLAGEASALASELQELPGKLPAPVANAITGDLGGGGNGLAQVTGGACGACGESLAGEALSAFNAADSGTVFVCEACEVPLLKA